MFIFFPSVLCVSIAEIPDVQYKLSLRQDVMEQALMAASLPLYTSKLVVMTINLLVCLSRCRQAHEGLMKPRLIEKVMELHQHCKESVKPNDDPGKLMVME